MHQMRKCSEVESPVFDCNSTDGKGTGPLLRNEGKYKYSKIILK